MSTLPPCDHDECGPTRCTRTSELASAAGSTLGEMLPKEIERCQELLTQYAEIGPAGQFGAMMIRRDIRIAHAAMIQGDLVGMIRAYNVLKECK